SNSALADPISHQFAGSNLYAAKPGVCDALNAAATGLRVRAASTVRWPNGASRPSQTSRGATHTPTIARYDAAVAPAVVRNRLLAAALTSTVNTAVAARHPTTR